VGAGGGRSPRAESRQGKAQQTAPDNSMKKEKRKKSILMKWEDFFGIK
jgi:hypothetical protein